MTAAEHLTESLRSPERLHIACAILACMGQCEMMRLTELHALLRHKGVPEAHGDIRLFGRWVGRSGFPSVMIDASRERWVRADGMRRVVSANHGVVIS